MAKRRIRYTISARKARSNTNGKPKIRMSRVCAAKITSTSSRPLCIPLCREAKKLKDLQKT
jgi:hypothetical protein